MAPVVKNVLLFFVLIALGRLWVGVDQFFLPRYLLFPAFTIIICLLMIGYFFVVKPARVRRFSFILSCSVALAVCILSITQHVILQHDFAMMWRHSLLLLAISFSLPLVIGAGYGMASKNNRVQQPTQHSHLK